MLGLWLPIQPDLAESRPEATFPHSLARASFHASRQMATTAPPPAAVPVGWAPSYPAAVVRAAVAVAALQSFAAPVVLERAAPLAAAVYPDRIDRLSFGAHRQLAAPSSPATLERTSPLATVVYPDRVDRLSFGAHQQFVTPGLPVAPERTSLLATVGYPDRVDRLSFGAHLQLATPGLAVAPERTAPFVAAVYPDAVLRSEGQASRQMAGVLVELPPAMVPAVFPDSFARLALGPGLSFVGVEVPPSPRAVYPEAFARPACRVDLQQAFAWVALPSAAPVVVPFFDGVYPSERPGRGFLGWQIPSGYIGPITIPAVPVVERVPGCGTLTFEATAVVTLAFEATAVVTLTFELTAFAVLTFEGC